MEREDTHASQFSEEFDRINFVVGTGQDLLGEASALDNRVCASHHEGTCWHELRGEEIQTRDDSEGHEQGADVLGE